MKLRQALDTLPMSDLRALATAYRINVSPSTLKPDLVTALHRQLTMPSVINMVVKELSENEHAALNTLIAEGGRIMAHLFARDFGAIRYSDPYAYGPQSIWGEPQTAAEGLYTRGLIYKEYGEIGTWRGEIYSIPDEVLALLPRVRKTPFADVLIPAPEPAYHAVKGDLVRDIGMFICFLSRETVRTVHIDRLSKRDILKLNDDMSLWQDLGGLRQESDAPWISFVHHMAHLLGLIRLQGGLLTVSEQGEAWLQQSRERQIWELWRRYQKDGTWDEIKSAIAKQYVYSYPGAQYVVATRKRVLDALKLCPLGKWLTTASLEAAIRMHDPSFLRTELHSNTWQYWSSSLFIGGWDEVEGALIHYLLNRSFNWLGIVQAGASSQEGQNPVFRLTELGAILLGLRKGNIVTPSSEPIVVQANFEIIVPAETSPAVVYQVQKVAELHKRDRASIYTLTQNAVWRNLQAGGDVERLIAFLEKTAGRPLPQNVAYSLRAWTGKHGEVALAHVLLLQAASEALMAEILANKKVGIKVKETISPRAVTLAEDNVSTLIAQLKKHGYWPKLDDNIVADEQVREETAGSTTNIKTSQLVQLLAAATVLSHIAENNGWSAPVSDWLVRQLSWRLSPSHLKQLNRLTSEAIAAHDAATGSHKHAGDHTDDKDAL